MSSTLRLLAAAALLAVLGGCANWTPNWTPNAPGEGLNDPMTYEPTPSG